MHELAILAAFSTKPASSKYLYTFKLFQSEWHINHTCTSYLFLFWLAQLPHLCLICEKRIVFIISLARGAQNPKEQAHDALKDPKKGHKGGKEEENAGHGKKDVVKDSHTTAPHGGHEKKAA